jgi:hypothetical protein
MTYFWQIFDKNLNKIVQFFKKDLKKKLEGFFQEYSPKNNRLKGH